MGSSPLPKFSLLSPKNDNSINYLYHKTRHSYIYMLRIAGQMVGSNGLNFFVDTHGWPGVKKVKKLDLKKIPTGNTGLFS